MENNYLVKTDGIMYKIKTFFKKVFGGKNRNTGIKVEDIIQEKFTDKEQSVFKNKLMVEYENESNAVKRLVTLLKIDKTAIKNLTKEQKEDVIEFLKEQIEDKTEKISNIKRDKRKMTEEYENYITIHNILFGKISTVNVENRVFGKYIAMDKHDKIIFLEEIIKNGKKIQKLINDENLYKKLISEYCIQYSSEVV